MRKNVRKKVEKKRKITTDFTNLHGFLGENLTKGGKKSEKCAQTYVKKAKNLQICAKSYTKDTWQDQKKANIFSRSQ